MTNSATITQMPMRPMSRSTGAKGVQSVTHCNDRASAGQGLFLEIKTHRDHTFRSLFPLAKSPCARRTDTPWARELKQCPDRPAVVRHLGHRHPATVLLA